MQQRVTIPQNSKVSLHPTALILSRKKKKKIYLDLKKKKENTSIEYEFPLFSPVLTPTVKKRLSA